MNRELIETIQRVRNMPMVMARLFEKPKCKPWDIVKGRRMACCHGLGGHTRSCLNNAKWENVIMPQFRSISVRDLTNE